MRIECSECEEGFDAEIALVVGQVVRFTCTHCTAVSEVRAVSNPVLESAAAAAAAAVSDPVLESAAAADIGRALCPKCAAPIASKKGCGTCGLQREYFESYQQEAVSAGQESDLAWTRLLKEWPSERAHLAFAHSLADAGDYRMGVSLYRREAESAEACGDLHRSEVCRSMLQNIQEMASASLLLKRRPAAPEKEPYKGVVVLLFILVLIGAAGGIYLVIKKSRETPIPRVTPPAFLEPSRPLAP